jgi:hypothetical protein
VRGQLKNVPLMMHIKKAKAGQRILLAGEFNSKAEPKIAKCLPLIERALTGIFYQKPMTL